MIEEKIDLEVRSLETCMYDQKTFSEILNRIQKAVDDLNLHSYSNLPIWVNKLDIEVSFKRLEHNSDYFFFFGLSSSPPPILFSCSFIVLVILF